MSKPKDPWWGYMREIIRRYPKCSDFERRAVEQAIASTERMPDGVARLSVVNAVLMKKTHTLSGAARMVPVSYATAKRWQQAFIRETARHFCCESLLKQKS